MSNAVDDALPFRPAQPSGPAIELRPGAGVPLTRRPALKQLGSPGSLIPLAAFLASSGTGGQPQSGGSAGSVPQSGPVASTPISVDASGGQRTTPATPDVSASGETPPISSPPLSPQADKPVSDSPWTRHSGAPAPLSLSKSGTSEASPWLQSQTVAADLLPSAAINIPTAKAPEPAAAPVAPAEGGSRTGMTIGLVVAALALIGAIVYFAVAGKRKTDDTANVKAGPQKEYDMSASATATASETAKPPPPPPPPVVKPQVKQQKKGGDIYDDL
jgi:hypothetical protein